MGYDNNKITKPNELFPLHLQLKLYQTPNNANAINVVVGGAVRQGVNLFSIDMLNGFQNKSQNEDVNWVLLGYWKLLNKTNRALVKAEQFEKNTHRRH